MIFCNWPKYGPEDGIYLDTRIDYFIKLMRKVSKGLWRLKGQSGLIM